LDNDYIYARVSSQEQDTENQIAELKALYPDAIVVEETKSSLKVRPKLVNLLEMMTKGDRLIVWKLDRISRGMVEMQQICQDLDDRGITLISTTQNIDMSTTMGKMFIAILGMIAEMERENISERTLLGLKRSKAEYEIKAKKAKDAGKKIKAWRKDSTHKKGGRTPTPWSPKCLSRLSELKLLGHSWETIAEKLAYENAAWKMSGRTVNRTYNRMYSRKLTDRKSFLPKV